MNKLYMSNHCMDSEHELELLEIDFLTPQKRQSSFFEIDCDVNGKKLEQSTADEILNMWSPDMDAINFVENKLFKQDVMFFSEEPMPMDHKPDIIEQHFNLNNQNQGIIDQNPQRCEKGKKRRGRPSKKQIKDEPAMEMDIYQQQQEKQINNKTKSRTQKSRGENGILKNLATQISLKLFQYPSGVGKNMLTQNIDENRRKRTCDVLIVLTSLDAFASSDNSCKTHNPIITADRSKINLSFLEKQIQQKKLTIEIKKLLILKKLAIRKLQQQRKENQNLFRYLINIDNNTSFQWNERKQIFFLNQLINNGRSIRQTPIDPENLLNKVKSQELPKIPFVSEYMSKLIKIDDQKSVESSQVVYRSSVMVDDEVQSCNSVNQYMNYEIASKHFQIDFQSFENPEESRNN